jgi:hypothetical protein
VLFEHIIVKAGEGGLQKRLEFVFVFMVEKARHFGDEA